jgi:hypothetical protein
MVIVPGDWTRGLSAATFGYSNLMMKSVIPKSLIISWLCCSGRFHRDYKLEIRIPKSETNPKFKCSNAQNVERQEADASVLVSPTRTFRSLAFRSFSIVSNFVLRHSDLNLMNERLLARPNSSTGGS